MRVYFRETSRMQSFAKMKPSRNGENALSFTDVGKSWKRRGTFNVANLKKHLMKHLLLKTMLPF